MDTPESAINTPLEESQAATPHTDVPEVPSFVVNDMPLPEEPVGEAPKEPFEPTSILDLPGMSSEVLAKIEQQLANEFSTLSKDFVDARKPRIEYLLKRIDMSIAAAENHDREWSKVCSSRLKGIESVFTALEHYLLGNTPEMPNEEDLKNSISSIVAPSDLDDIATRNEQLPFSPFFQKILRPYLTQLEASHNQYNYQNNLIDQTVERNQKIIWTQYLTDVFDKRNDLIDKTYQELTALYEEYHDIRPNEKAANEWKHYYKSVVPSEEPSESDRFQQIRHKRGNIDSYYDVDNRYFKKNKIMLTKAKYDALNALQDFQIQQQGQYIPQRDDAIVTLTSCEGLTQDEVDNDIEALRALTQKPASTSKPESPKEDSTENAAEPNEDAPSPIKEAHDEGFASPGIKLDAAVSSG